MQPPDRPERVPVTLAADLSIRAAMEAYRARWRTFGPAKRERVLASCRAQQVLLNEIMARRQRLGYDE